MDVKLFLIKLQNDGKGHSTIKTVHGVLRPAFQMAVDDDALNKNSFGFALAGVVVNDSVTREAITKKQMEKFLKFIHDDNCYYYDVVYIRFHTGIRISEFCGLTVRDIDLKHKILNIDHGRAGETLRTVNSDCGDKSGGITWISRTYSYLRISRFGLPGMKKMRSGIYPYVQYVQSELYNQCFYGSYGLTSFESVVDCSHTLMGRWDPDETQIE